MGHAGYELTSARPIRYQISCDGNAAVQDRHVLAKFVTLWDSAALVSRNTTSNQERFQTTFRYEPVQLTSICQPIATPQSLCIYHVSSSCLSVLNLHFRAPPI